MTVCCSREKACKLRRCSRPIAVLGTCAILLEPRQVRACSGRFECTDFVNGTGDLRWSGGHSSAAGSACMYGHAAAAGDCAPPCDGVRYGSCRCLTSAEAAEGIKSQCWAPFAVSIAVTLLGSVCVTVLIRHWTRWDQASMEWAAGSSSSKDDDLGEYDESQALGNQDLEAPSVVQLRSQTTGLQQASGRLDRFSLERPLTYAAIRCLATTFALGLLGFGMSRVFGNHKIYDNFGNFLLGICTILMMFLLLSNVSVRVGKWMSEENSASLFSLENHLCLDVERTVLQIWTMIPVVGLAGLGWSVNRMANPQGWYHNACH